jgi:hypothetical protein
VSDLLLGNLVTVKRHLLAASLRSGTDYDAVITDIAKGVAAQMQRRCNRVFARLASATMKFPADTDHVIAERYPLEAVTSVHVQENPTTGFVESVGAIANWNADSGIVWFGSTLGCADDVARLTYTGGYWYDTAETEDTAQPSGSTALPSDLKFAWLTQCSHVWASRDKLGAGIVGKPGVASQLGDLKLVPEVLEILNGYIRFAML